MTSFPMSRPTLLMRPKDIPLGRLSIRAQHEIRGCKGIKMEGVAMNKMGRIEKLPKLF